jgi:hypothetical protein
MTPFLDLPIRQRLRWIIGVPAFLALAMVGPITTTYDYTTFRDRLGRELGL